MISTEKITKTIKIILNTLVIVGIISVLISMTILKNNGGFVGSLAGFITAMIVFGIAIRAGIVILSQKQKLAVTMLLLTLSQILLWGLVGFSIIKLHINHLAFLIGFTTLPIGIIAGYIASLGIIKEQ